MSTLYWITVLGNLNTLAIVVFAISTVITVITTVYTLEDDCFSYVIRLRNWGFVVLVSSFLGMLFIPSTEQLYKIYGVGGTIDYLKENPTAKELPDKCIKALDTWVDNFNKEEGNND